MGYWRHNNNCSLNSIHSFARALTLFLSLADSFLGVRETSPALSQRLCHCCTSLSALSLTPAGLVVIDVLSGFSTSDVNFFFSFVFCFCFAGFSRFALLLLLECIFFIFVCWKLKFLQFLLLLLLLSGGFSWLPLLRFLFYDSFPLFFLLFQLMLLLVLWPDENSSFCAFSFSAFLGVSGRRIHSFPHCCTFAAATFLICSGSRCCCCCCLDHYH